MPRPRKMLREHLTRKFETLLTAEEDERVRLAAEREMVPLRAFVRRALVREARRVLEPAKTAVAR